LLLLLLLNFNNAALKTSKVTQIKTITSDPYPSLLRDMQTKPNVILTGLEFILKKLAKLKGP
jgi:hypothetical protein